MVLSLYIYIYIKYTHHMIYPCIRSMYFFVHHSKSAWDSDGRLPQAPFIAGSPSAMRYDEETGAFRLQFVRDPVLMSRSRLETSASKHDGVYTVDGIYIYRIYIYIYMGASQNTRYGSRARAHTRSIPHDPYPDPYPIVQSDPYPTIHTPNHP